ncbi:MAG: OadG family protein [Chromatiaceae bacterium]|nr:OadG family protein [Chromatiaceae bacterium]
MMTNLLVQGVELMLLGMGIVFSFLAILVFTLRGMSWLADRLDTAPVSQPSTATAPIDVSDSRELVAVIAAAVARYRASRSG